MELYESPIKNHTWTAACGGQQCCIEIAELEGGGYALRNSQNKGEIIRATRAELAAFATLIPSVLEEG